MKEPEPAPRREVSESDEILERVARDSGSIGGSPLGRLGRRVGDHFAGADATGMGENGADDAVEVWGRRIGRALSVVLGLALSWWLGAQLGWW